MRPLTCAFVAVLVVVCSAGLKTRGAIADFDQRGAPPPATTQAPNLNAAPPETGTGAISGVVIDGTTKAPLQGAIVYLGPPDHGPPGAPVRQLTDPKGRFIFRGLPARSGYFLAASKPGYFDGHYGRGSGGTLGARISLADGQWLADATVMLWRPAAINGRVTDQFNEPVVGVFVRVLTKVLIAGREHLMAGQVTKTDDRGAYRIANLAPGAYVVQVPSVQESLPAAFTPFRARGSGTPSPDPTSSLPAIELAGGNRLLVGRYATPLPPENGRPQVYPPTFYPGATTLTAALSLDLAHGEDRMGIDIRLEPVQTSTISGRLDGPLDAITGMPIRLLPSGLDGLGDGSEAATGITRADGSFTLFNVPPGTYTLLARRTLAQFESRPLIGTAAALPRAPAMTVSSSIGRGVPSAPPGTSVLSRTMADAADAYWARMPLSVDRTDIIDLVVPVRRAAAMKGRFVWDAVKPLSSPGIHLRLEPANGDLSLGMPQTRIDEDPTVKFVLDGLLPGEYILVGVGGRIKSVAWNGRDYTHQPFDARAGEDFEDVVVTLTSDATALSGTVRDDRGVKTVDDPAVIVFPVEPELWSNFGFSPARVKAIQTTNAGRYTFQSLPAGDYFAVAVDGELIDGWKDPTFLKRAAPLATRISLAWGDKVEHALRVVTIK